MKRQLDYRNLSWDDRGAAVAIGNFDGVHLGHQSVLALARAAAVSHDAPFGVVTFEPHPRSFFQKDAPPFRLMTADVRARRLEKLGVEQLYEIPFNADLASLTADQFVEDILVGALGIVHLVAGADFRFGKGRTGDVDFLKTAGAKFGFDVTVAPLVSDGEGDYSSTAIRNALADGDPATARRILGHWHRMEGQVQHGDKRGRNLGFPTINLDPDGLHIPKYGVYSVLVDVLTGSHVGTYAGAASFGERPTFGKNAPNIEVYLLDFSGDLYGELVSVALVDYQRSEWKFDDVEALKSQMALDVQKARATTTPFLP